MEAMTSPAAIETVRSAILRKKALRITREGCEHIATPYILGTDNQHKWAVLYHEGVNYTSPNRGMNLKCVRLDDMTAIQESSHNWLTPPEPDSARAGTQGCIVVVKTAFSYT